MMSKNIRNKNYYYEVGVLNLDKEIIAEYVTNLPIIRYGQQVSDKLMNLIKEEYGNDIVVVWNKKNGKLPNDNRPIIDIDVSIEPELNYNR